MRHRARTLLVPQHHRNRDGQHVMTRYCMTWDRAIIRDGGDLGVRELRY